MYQVQIEISNKTDNRTGEAGAVVKKVVGRVIFRRELARYGAVSRMMKMAALRALSAVLRSRTPLADRLYLDEAAGLVLQASGLK